MNEIEESLIHKIIKLRRENMKLEAKNNELMAECGHRAISINELNRIIDDIEDWGIVSCDEPLLKLIKALKAGEGRD